MELVLRETRNDALNQGKRCNMIFIQHDGNPNEGGFIRSIEPEMKLLAYNNLVGRLIGKSGTTIKKIMEDSACVVFLSKWFPPPIFSLFCGFTFHFLSYGDITPFYMERTVTIRGPSLANISHAEAMISAKLRASQIQDMTNPVSFPPFLYFMNLAISYTYIHVIYSWINKWI